MNQKVKELRGMIYSKYNSESDFANSLGWPRQKLNKITNGIKEPTIEELNQLSIGLDVSVEAMAQIFLRLKSPNEQQK